MIKYTLLKEVDKFVIFGILHYLRTLYTQIDTR